MALVSPTWSHLGKGQVWQSIIERKLMAKGGGYLIGEKFRNCCFLEGCVHRDCDDQQQAVVAAS